MRRMQESEIYFKYVHVGPSLAYELTSLKVFVCLIVVIMRMSDGVFHPFNN